LLGTENDGGRLVVERSAVGMPGQAQVRRRATPIEVADVALAHVAGEHDDLFRRIEFPSLS